MRPVDRAVLESLAAFVVKSRADDGWHPAHGYAVSQLLGVLAAAHHLVDPEGAPLAIRASEPARLALRYAREGEAGRLSFGLTDAAGRLREGGL